MGWKIGRWSEAANPAVRCVLTIGKGVGVTDVEQTQAVDFDDYVAARAAELLRFAYLLTGDRERSEDLVQTVLIDVYRHWKRVSKADKPDAYVHQMMINANTSWWRRLSNREEPAALGVQSGPSTDDPAEILASRDMAERALRSLPARSRTVLILRYYADYNDATIAAMLRIREGTVRALASRALARLRETSGDPSVSAQCRQYSGGEAR